jgi:spermidine dehydrogenase
MSYRDYLLNVAKFHPDVLPYAGGVWCLPDDAGSAWFAHFRAKPGFAGLGVERPWGSPESAEHQKGDYGTPGGNHSICRLMVRDLIPEALPQGDFVAVETERLNYATLDRPNQATRIRLNSTVVRAKHVGTAPHQFEPDNREVEVTYVGVEGRAYMVRAKDVVLAGFNNMIPYICPEIAEGQKEGLRKSVRSINMSTNVLLRNWEAFDKLKVNSVAFPGNYLQGLSLHPARSFGSMKASMDPSQPILANFNFSHGVANQTFLRELLGGQLPTPGTPARDQMRMARAGLFRTPFERFERQIRADAAAALGAGGFDPARDILAVAVNRWGHGYALGNNVLFDGDGPVWHEVGRKKFGRIAIANSDASGIDNVQTAIDEAHRAIQELEPRMYGYYGVI